MKNTFKLIAWTGGLFFSISAFSQYSLDSLLTNVSKNNKSVMAYNQLLEANKMEYKTGLYLDNPTVDYDYMIGTPANAGNQTDITAVQSFDFPTVYAKRKGVSNANIEKLELQAKGYKQSVLLEAKLVYMELVYLNKYHNQLSKRKENAEQLQTAFQGKYEMGDATILDVNKGKMNFTQVKNELRLTESKKAEMNQKLTELNGGINIAVSDTLYPIKELLPDLDALFVEAIKGEYSLQSIQQDQEISQKEEQLKKALALPKLEGGYRHQSIVGQNYNGFHAGISIPLFENKNKVQAAKQRTLYYSLLGESHKNQYHNELEALYNKVQSLQKSMEDYRQLHDGVNNEVLLNKTLQIGEISSIEYFMELSYYYSMYDDYLELEKEHQKALAMLYRYSLL